MKKFKFEINIEEQDVNGDEFWEEAIEKDGTGIETLTKAIETIFLDSHLFVSSNKEIKDIVKLTNFTDENKTPYFIPFKK